MKIKAGYTSPWDWPEHREVRRYFSWRYGCGAGLVTRSHGTLWVQVRWCR